MPRPRKALRVDRHRLARHTGKLVRQAREALGIERQALAARAGYSVSAIGMIESGRQTPSLGSLLELADALALEPAALLPPREKVQAKGIKIDDRRNLT